MIIDAFVGNVLRLAHGVASNIHGQTVVSRISLQSSVRANVILQSVDNFLGLHDWATAHRSVTVAHMQDNLNLSSTPSKGPLPQSVIQAIGFWQQIVNTGFQDANNQLNLTQTVGGFAGKWAASNLSLSQDVNVNIIKVLTVANIISFTGKQAAFKPSVNFLAFADPLLHESHPYFQIGNDKVILRSPQFGNTEKVQQNRIMRKTRAGDLIIFRDSQWPTMTTLHMDFSYIDPLTAHHLLVFMREHMGQKVKFYDNEQRTWTGYIMTPASQIAEQLRNNYTVTIEFQGIQVPLHVRKNSQKLSLTQVIGLNVIKVINVSVNLSLSFSGSVMGGYGVESIVEGSTIVNASNGTRLLDNDGVQLIRFYSYRSEYDKLFFTAPGNDPANQFVLIDEETRLPVDFIGDDQGACWRLAGSSRVLGSTLAFTQSQSAAVSRELFVGQSLSFSSLANGETLSGQPVLDNLSFVCTASAVMSFQRSQTDNISITQFCGKQSVFSPQISQSFELAQTPFSNQSIVEEVSHAELISQVLTVSAVRNQSVSQDAVFSQIVGLLSAIGQEVSQSLVMVSTTSQVAIRSPSLSEALALTQLVNSDAVLNLPTSHSVTFSQTIGLNLVDLEAVTANVILTQATGVASVFKRSANSSLVLVETQTFSGIYPRTVAETLAITETIIGTAGSFQLFKGGGHILFKGGGKIRYKRV